MSDLSPADIVKLLADGDRFRVVSAMVLGADDLESVKTATGLGHRAATLAVSRLVSAGLVERDGHGLRVAEERVRAAARNAVTPPDPTSRHPLVDPAVLRAFVDGATLVAIPTSRRKLLQVLDLLAQDFEVGTRFSEAQVNEVLRRWHPDVATLRRHLVDHGFLDREGGGGTYWRSGGSTLT